MTQADLNALRARIGSLSRSLEAARTQRNKLRRQRDAVADYADTLKGLAADARRVGRAPSTDFKSMKTEGPFTQVLRSNAARHSTAVISAADAVADAARVVKQDAKRLEREAAEADDRVASLEYELAMTRRSLSMLGG